MNGKKIIGLVLIIMALAKLRQQAATGSGSSPGTVPAVPEQQQIS